MVHGVRYPGGRDRGLHLERGAGGGARRGTAGVGQLLPRAGRAAGARTQHHQRGIDARPAPGDPVVARFLAAPFCRTGLDRRHPDPDGTLPVPGRRHHARGLSFWRRPGGLLGAARIPARAVPHAAQAAFPARRGAPASGSHRGGGARRPDGYCRRARGGISRDEHQDGRGSRTARRLVRRQRAEGAPGLPRRGRVPAPGRLRERRESDAVARHRTGPRESPSGPLSAPGACGSPASCSRRARSSRSPAGFSELPSPRGACGRSWPSALRAFPGSTTSRWTGGCSSSRPLSPASRRLPLASSPRSTRQGPTRPPRSPRSPGLERGAASRPAGPWWWPRLRSRSSLSPAPA